MKIVFDSLVFALHKFGGVTTYWNEFIRRFKQDHSDLTILTVPAGKYLNDEFIQIHSGGIKLLPEKNWPLQLLRNTSAPVAGLTAKFIFHSTYLRTSSNKNAINVVTIHDFTHQFFVKGLKQLLNYRQKKDAIKNAHGIVCISQNTLKDLYRFFPEAKEKLVTVIYNGCSDTYTSDVQTPPVVKTPEPYLLFVGARGNYKNFQFVVNVLRKSSYHLVVAGSKFTEEETKMMSEFGERVTLLNDLSDEKLRSLYQHAHAFIYPSLYEGFGIPLLEAMHCGCPVIAFNNSCIPEIMQDSPLLLENDNLGGALDVLTKLETTKYREDVIASQRANAKRFSWDKAHHEMKEFYQRCMDRTA
ncbi:glycosyltransferase family 1 protein [Chryseolinea sp. T2]|uniref:glycosyltransferase family 4 protein n=1 Tax=Chryseolinea sp. T2 TaxID=3129255 RepID=UPI003076B08B